MRKKFKAAVVFVTAWAFFVPIFYLLKTLIEKGQPVFDALNNGPHEEIHVWHIVVILLAMVVAACLVFLLQLLKSIWDITFKKTCDDAAKGIVEWIEK